MLKEKAVMKIIFVFFLLSVMASALVSRIFMDKLKDELTEPRTTEFKDLIVSCKEMTDDLDVYESQKRILLSRCIEYNLIRFEKEPK